MPEKACKLPSSEKSRKQTNLKIDQCQSPYRKKSLLFSKNKSFLRARSTMEIWALWTEYYGQNNGNGLIADGVAIPTRALNIYKER